MGVFISLGTLFLGPNHTPLLFVYTMHDACQAVPNKDIICLLFPSLSTRREFSHIVTTSFPGGQSVPSQAFLPMGFVVISQAKRLSSEEWIHSSSSSTQPVFPPTGNTGSLFLPLIQRAQDHSTSQMAEPGELCISSSVVTLKLQYENHLEDWLKHRLLHPTPEFLMQYIWRGAQECAFLVGSMLVPMILFWGPHSENCCSSPQSCCFTGLETEVQ